MAIILWLFASPVLLLTGILLWALWTRRGFPHEREKDAGTYADHFVYVKEDGSARQLTADERNHLNTKFHPTDGGRPYIKYCYGKIAPDGKISGYLLRKRLPRHVPIADSEKAAG
jgi:hypothetical protein